MENRELEHLAFSIAHGTFDRNSPGGCSCELCQKLLQEVDHVHENEAAEYYNEHYPPIKVLPPEEKLQVNSIKITLF